MSDEYQRPLSRIVSDDARQAHAELIEALGTEAHDGQWMRFMRAVERWIPHEVFEAGRPSTKRVEMSPIGKLGYGSWHDLVTGDTNAGGLGLPWSRWKEWRRSWKIVTAHPWLEDEDMTASAVRMLAKRIEDENVQWPESSGEMRRFENWREEQREQRRGESIKALKERIGEVEDELHQSRDERIRLEGIAEAHQKSVQAAERRESEERERRESIAGEWHTMKAQVDRLEGENQSLKERATNAETNAGNLQKEVETLNTRIGKIEGQRDQYLTDRNWYMELLSSGLISRVWDAAMHRQPKPPRNIKH